MLLRNKWITPKQQQNYLFHASIHVFHSVSVDFSLVHGYRKRRQCSAYRQALLTTLSTLAYPLLIKGHKPRLLYGKAAKSHFFERDEETEITNLPPFLTGYSGSSAKFQEGD